MAKYKPMEMVEEYHGKACGHSKMSFAKRYDTLYTQTRCKSRNLEKCPYTPKELKVKAWFRATRQAIENLSEEQKNAYAAAWREYDGTKYHSLNGYIFGIEFAKAKQADPYEGD